MATDLHLGDTVSLRKPHPFGGFDWEDKGDWWNATEAFRMSKLVVL